MTSLASEGPGSSVEVSSADSKQPESTPKPEPTVYRYVPEGSGGTYTFADGDIQYIGTTVYCKLDNNRCFFAHINADCIDRRGRWTRQINSEREAVIKQTVKERLDAEQKSSNWGPITDGMRSILVTTCLSFAVGAPKVGDAIIAAVLEWLGIEEIRQINRSQAFVVDHLQGQATFFDIEAPTSEWFMQVEMENNAWAFVVEEEE
ncbi:hypothetical protein LTR86_006443 [Recurvomyces mirabilis]|nr:hypothetical protein LTR86_006443 [Recurvomyces mirabilis]